MLTALITEGVFLKPLLKKKGLFISKFTQSGKYLWCCEGSKSYLMNLETKEKELLISDCFISPCSETLDDRKFAFFEFNNRSRMRFTKLSVFDRLEKKMLSYPLELFFKNDDIAFMSITFDKSGKLFFCASGTSSYVICINPESGKYKVVNFDGIFFGGMCLCENKLIFQTDKNSSDQKKCIKGFLCYDVDTPFSAKNFRTVFTECKEPLFGITSQNGVIPLLWSRVRGDEEATAAEGMMAEIIHVLRRAMSNNVSYEIFEFNPEDNSLEKVSSKPIKKSDFKDIGRRIANSYLITEDYFDFFNCDKESCCKVRLYDVKNSIPAGCFFAENGKISFEDADSDKIVIVEDKSVNINSEMITKGLSVWFSRYAKYLGFSFNDYVYYAEAPEKFLNILNKYR